MIVRWIVVATLALAAAAAVALTVFGAIAGDLDEPQKVAIRHVGGVQPERLDGDPVARLLGCERRHVGYVVLLGQARELRGVGAHGKGPAGDQAAVLAAGRDRHGGCERDRQSDVRQHRLTLMICSGSGSAFPACGCGEFAPIVPQGRSDAVKPGSVFGA